MFPVGAGGRIPSFISFLGYKGRGARTWLKVLILGMLRVQGVDVSGDKT